ncbi:2-dehydropantoate 2-reductase [Oxalobacteraceae bacterium OM1]|nr:2-dehydropantoate 2-reductase [Oxalobacteraceae bacterium OM1]
MRIVVFGAGSIGVYVGGCLLAGGADVVLLGRARMGERLRREGLLLTDLYGGRHALAGSDIPFTEDPAVLREAALVLVTVKSADTAQAANTLREFARPDAVVLSLQNGIGNADVLRGALPGQTIVGGMVPFNVVQMEGGRFHRGTEGDLMTEATPALGPWHAAFAAAHLPLAERSDFLEVQWGKLLLNLNNPVNALSGVPLKTELSQRAYRRCLALLMEEALSVLKVAGIQPAKLGKVAPGVMPRLLRLPDFLFARIAGAMLRIDPEARSSMWEDLQAGRRTEVDYINGAVVKLAQSVGKDAPANRKVIELMRGAEEKRVRALSGEQLFAELASRS